MDIRGNIFGKKIFEPSFTAGQYPMLLLPKKYAPIMFMHQFDEDDINFEVKITSSAAVYGTEMCIYKGICGFKLLDNPVHVTLNSCPRDVESEDLTAANQQQYADRDYQNYNRYDPNQSWQYPVSYQTRSQHVTIEQRNTFITQNVYDDSAVGYSPYEIFGRQRQHDIEPVKRSIPNPNQCLDFHEDRDRGVQRSAYDVDDSGIADASANEALIQHMSPDIQQMSKKRNTNLYSGPDDSCGQTIHRIGDKDPKAECSSAAMEVANEVIIDSLEPTHPNKKIYHRANYEQMFDQLSNFREHQKRHTETSQSDKIRYSCYDCGKQLTTYEKYMQHILAHGDPDLECPKCGKIFVSKYTLRVHLKIHSRQHRCNFCTRSYNDLESLTAHLASFHSRYECENCNYLALTKADLVAHQKIHDDVYSVSDSNPSNPTEYHLHDNNIDYSNSGERDWICENYYENQENRETTDDGCNTLKNDYEHFENHEITEAAYIPSGENNYNPYLNENQSIEQIKSITNTESTHLIVQDKQVEIECNFDNDKSTNNTVIINSADQPIIRENSVQSASQSDGNGNQFDESGSRFEDVRSQHSNGTFYDTQDDSDDEDFKLCIDEGSDRSKSYRTSDSIIKKAIASKAFKIGRSKKSRQMSKVCDVCDKRFDRMSDLKRHLVEHVVRMTLAQLPATSSGILNIECQVCHRATFSTIEEYKVHLRQHAKLTIYQCTFCNKSFGDSSNFCKHKKVHGDTHFQCDLCRRKFNSKETIIRHMEHHKKTVPMPCPVCGEIFHFKSTLQKHMKYGHSKDTSKFKCRFCWEHFETMKLKWDHEWVAHKIRKIIVDCSLCGAQFRKSSDLKRHSFAVHKIVFLR